MSDDLMVEIDRLVLQHAVHSSASERQAAVNGLARIAREQAATLNALYSEEPCAKCGSGVAATCYGCIAKAATERAEKAEAENARLNAKLDQADKIIDGLQYDLTAAKDETEAALRAKEDR